jgi:cytochrome b561
MTANRERSQTFHCPMQRKTSTTREASLALHILIGLLVLVLALRRGLKLHAQRQKGGPLRFEPGQLLAAQGIATPQVASVLG